MRKDTILIVLGFTVVAAVTYFILDNTLERSEPQLANVVPDEPPIVQQQKAAKSAKAREIASAGLPPEEKAKLAEKQAASSAPEDTTENKSGSGDAMDKDTESADAMESDSAEEASDANSTPKSDASSSSPAPTSDSSAKVVPANVTVASQEDDGDEEAMEADDSSATDESDSEKSDQASAKKESASSTADQDSAPKQAAKESKAPAYTGKPASKGDEVVATAVINIRAEATTSSEVIGQLQPGDIVVLTSDAKDDWAQIKPAEQSGWIYLPLFRYPVGAPE